MILTTTKDKVEKYIRPDLFPPSMLLYVWPISRKRYDRHLEIYWKSCPKTVFIDKEKLYPYKIYYLNRYYVSVDMILKYVLEPPVKMEKEDYTKLFNIYGLFVLSPNYKKVSASVLRAEKFIKCHQKFQLGEIYLLNRKKLAKL